MFSLFTDMLCNFANDFINFESVVGRLKKWAAAGSASNSSKLIQPRVIIVKRGDKATPSPTHAFLKMQDTQFNLNREVLKNFYSSITALHLARFRQLKELLWKNMDEIQQVWQRNNLNCCTVG